MDFFENFNLTPGKMAKFAGLAVLVLFVLYVAVEIFGMNARGLGLGNSTMSSKSYPGAMMAPAYDTDDAIAENGIALSERNIAPIPPQDGYASGGDAEEFEVTDYHATIETGNAEETCSVVKNLKSHDYVIFEHSNESEDSCSYTFKVAKNEVGGVLGTIESLDPRELTENTRTIKNQIVDYTSELEILENKLAAIESTLADAVTAYDEITSLARNTGNADALAKVISSKVEIIERLTTQRISVVSQIERISRSKAEQLDRLDYTYFYVSVYENKYVDATSILDSWKRAVREFVYDVNKVLQAITVGFFSFLLLVLQYALYIVVLLFIAKFGWKLAKKIWLSQ